MTKCEWVDNLDDKIRDSMKGRMDGFPKVEIQFTKNDCSSYIPTQNLCKISLIACRRIYDFFKAMMCHPAFNQDVVNLCKSQDLFKWSDLGTDSFNISLPEEQLKSAEMLAETAIVFIVLHEMGHHEQKHFQFLTKESGEPTQEAINHYSCDGWLISQVLEVDADHFAYKHLSSTLDILRSNQFPSVEDETYCKAEWLIRLCYGVLLVREYTQNGEAATDNEASKHPIGITRLRYLISTELAKTPTTLKECFFKAFDNAAGVYDEALPALFDKGSEIRLKVPSDDNLNHDKKIFDLYEQMFPN